jgi:imidazolonepropionase-like amidohydrolase
MAYFRQLMYDATALQEHMMYFEKHSEMTQPEQNDVLEALFSLVNKEYPLYFEVDSKEEIERLFRLQDEFGFDVVLVSAKEASALSNELKSRNIAVLASIDVTEMPDWLEKEKKEAKKDDEEGSESEEEGDSEDAESEELTEEELMFRSKQKEAWEKEINNVSALLEAGIPTGFTSAGLSPKELQQKVDLITENSTLTKNDIVGLMTVHNANILGISNRVGTIKEGNSAHLILTDGPLFEKGTNIHIQVSQGVINDFMED